MQNHGADTGTSSLDLDVGSQLRHRTLALDSDAGPCLRCRTPPPAQLRTNLMNLLHPHTSSHELHGDHECVARAEPAELKSPQNQALLLTRIPTCSEEGCSPRQIFPRCWRTRPGGAGRAGGAVTAWQRSSVAGARCHCRITWVIKSTPAPCREIARRWVTVTSRQVKSQVKCKSDVPGRRCS